MITSIIQCWTGFFKQQCSPLSTVDTVESDIMTTLTLLDCTLDVYEPSMISDLPVVQWKLEDLTKITLIPDDLEKLGYSLNCYVNCLFKMHSLFIVPDFLKRSSIPAPQCFGLYEAKRWCYYIRIFPVLFCSLM